MDKFTLESGAEVTPSELFKAADAKLQDYINGKNIPIKITIPDEELLEIPQIISSQSQ